MSNEIMAKQTRLLIVVLILFFSILGGISYYAFQDEFSPKNQMTSTVLPLDKSNPQELWMMRLDSEKQITDQKIKYLEDLVLGNKQHAAEKDKENQLLREEIQKFKQELQKISELAQSNDKSYKKDALSYAESSSNPLREEIQKFKHEIIPRRPNLNSQNAEVAFRNDPFSYEESQTFPSDQIMPLTELIMPERPEKLQSVDQVIPACLSVKAIIVSSVNMPCGVAGSTDPQPVKLRIIDNGSLSSDVSVKVKGALLLGSAYGDLSTERIYIRLERITQVRKDGKFIESSVAGYITGEDGVYGVRGVVVDKSYNMVGNAAISGFFSGVNQYLQASASRNCNIFDSGYNINAGSVGMSGVSGGANNAFDTLTNYYIKRAEQIRPVIVVSAGRIVDITFSYQLEMGDLHVHDKIRQLREFNKKG